MLRPAFPWVPGSGWINAAGLKYRLGPPWITWPVKLGFKDGRTGLRVSPSLDGMEDNWGVKGRPDCSVSIPLTCQFPKTFFAQGFLSDALLRPKGRS